MISAIGLPGGRPLGQIAADSLGSEAGILADTCLRADIARFEVDAEAFQLALERTGDLLKAKQASPAISSMLKYYGAELNKRRHELLMSAGGSDALEWESERSRHGEAARGWLRTKAQLDRRRNQRSAAQRDRQAHSRIARRVIAERRWRSSSPKSR